MQFAIAADQLATFNKPPLLLSSTISPHLSSLRSQDLSPEPVWTTRPSQGLCSHRKFQSLLKLPGRGTHGLCWNVQLREILPRGQEKLLTSPINCKLWGTPGTPQHLGPLLGSRSTIYLPSWHKHKPRWEHPASCHPAARWQGEGRAVPVSDGLFFNLISQFEFKQFSPFREDYAALPS